MSKDQSFLKFYIVLIIVITAIGSLLMLSGGYSLGSIKGILVCIAFAIYNITGCICWVTSRKPEYNILGTVGVAASGLGFMLMFMLVMIGPSSMDSALGLVKLSFGVLIISIALAHICLMYYITIQNKYANTARSVAVICISLFSILFMVKIFGSFEMNIYSPMGELTYARLLGVSFLLDLSATSLVPICNRLEEPRMYEVTFTEPPVTETRPPDHTV